MHPITIVSILVLYLLGAGQIVGGIYLLLGKGWALIALGVFTIAAGWFTAKGAAAS